MYHRVPALDGVRAFAISLVIISHTALALTALGNQTLLMHVLLPYFADGELGVNVFFVLSGFLITTLLLRELGAEQKISLRSFYERRIRRILPAFYVWLAVVTALALAHKIAVSKVDLIGTALFVRSYVPRNDLSWWTANAWTLAVEEWFYLCFPALLVLLNKKIVPALLLVVLAEPAVRVVQFMLVHNAIVGYQVHARFDQIAYGCLLAFALRNDRIVKWYATQAADVVACAAFVAVFVIVPTIDARHHHMLFKLMLGLSLDGLGMAIILGYVVQRPLSLTTRILSAKPLVWIGLISYSLYLWQQLFITENDPLPWPAKAIGVVACAAGSYYFIERPFVARRQRALLELPASTNAFGLPS